ncbi:alpha/beta hydrolase [Streptomyces sp. NPDC050636]|uniref:alpha/beta hydrolase n=1 Tax=Streptomyces sp. NPDC050636 TaxID=3154510 RepID=UPI00344A1B10
MPMPLDPPIAALLEGLNAQPPLHFEGVDPEVLREANRQMAAQTPLPEPIEVGSVQDTSVPGPAGDIPVRVYRPAAGQQSVPTVVFFHGGGWLVGDLDTHDDVTRRLCRDVNAVVVSVHYRRVPENPYPAPLDDCLAATRWVADHIEEYGGRRDRLAVAGDSAGANAAAVIALTFRNDNQPLAAQLLAYPPTDFVSDRGPRVRDWGLHDKGVYTFTSHENPLLCSQFTGVSKCSGIEVLLCGSARHVIGEDDQPRTRMGSGSDWLHDMAAELVAMEERGETTLPESLVRTPRGMQEYAAKAAHDMMVSWRQGPVHVHGHARVLCNFEAVDGEHRLMVASPLYVETAPPPREGALVSRPTRRRWPWNFRVYPPTR